MDETRTGSQPPRRRRAGETRALLIDAAIDMVRAKGLSTLTAQGVAKASGISQPGFYKHFKNTDELLIAAVTGFLDDMASRQSLRNLNLSIEDLGSYTPEAWRQLLGDMLTVFVSEPRFTEIFLRYRSDPTVLGGAISSVADRVQEDLVSYCWEVAQGLGAHPRNYERVEIGCKQALALYFAAGEMLLSGQQPRERIVTQTADVVGQLIRTMIASFDG